MDHPFKLISNSVFKVGDEYFIPAYFFLRIHTIEHSHYFTKSAKINGILCIRILVEGLPRSLLLHLQEKIMIRVRDKFYILDHGGIGVKVFTTFIDGQQHLIYTCRFFDLLAILSLKHGFFEKYEIMLDFELIPYYPKEYHYRFHLHKTKFSRNSNQVAFYSEGFNRLNDYSVDLWNFHANLKCSEYFAASSSGHLHVSTSCSTIEYIITLFYNQRKSYPLALGFVYLCQFSIWAVYQEGGEAQTQSTNFLSFIILLMIWMSQNSLGPHSFYARLFTWIAVYQTIIILLHTLLSGALCCISWVHVLCIVLNGILIFVILCFIYVPYLKLGIQRIMERKDPRAGKREVDFSPSLWESMPIHSSREVIMGSNF